MKVKIAILLILLLTSSFASANPETNDQLDINSCTYGSHQELYTFFTEKKFAVIAQGKRETAAGNVKDFADVLFLISPDMSLFHTVILTGVKYDYFKACIFSSAREIDFQFASPIPNLLERINREHFVFITKNLPENTTCPQQTDTCMTWPQWSPLLEQTIFLSAYSFYRQDKKDPYNEPVELTIENKIIRPTRGKLSQHARVKYALRQRNELGESVKDIKAAKEAYIQIYNEADHKLPLIFLPVTEHREWRIIRVNRESGLAETIMKGIDLELYPMKNNAYKKLIIN